MVIFLFGPPGCGKGTQARLISDWLKVPSISTGDLLRAEVAAGSDLGREAQPIIAAGRLVPDDLVTRMLRARISQQDCGRGFLLDGYPRTLEQAAHLNELLTENPIVLHFDVPAGALVGRLVCRRQCPKCARAYNILTDRPKTPGACNDCGEGLVMRKDDREDVIRERLRAYDEITRPVLAHYYDAKYYLISGDRSANYIFEEVTEILDPIRD